MKNKKGMNAGGTVLLVIGVMIAIALIVGVTIYVSKPAVTESVITQSTAGAISNPSVNPAVTFSTLSKYLSNSISGTTYYKVGGLTTGAKASTTALANVNPASTYVYWVSNSSHVFVKPDVFVAGTLNNPIQNGEAYEGTTIALSSYDLDNRQTTTNSAYNTSLSAGGINNVEFTYQGTNQYGEVPFGGLFYIEMNTTINTVTCKDNGVSLSAQDPNLHLTYSPSSTNKLVVFTLPSGWDDGQAVRHIISCQFSASGTDPAGVYKVGIVPSAYYYNALDGQIYLDTEKFMNSGSSTRTAPASVSVTGLTNYFT